MTERFDIYTDGFNIGFGLETVSISLTLTPPPYDEGEDPAPRVLGTVRMSIRQMRAVTYAAWVAIRQMEREGLISSQPEPPGELVGAPDSSDNWEYLWVQGEVQQPER